MNATVAYHLSTTQDGGIPLSAFPKDRTSELAGFVFTLSFMLSAKQESCEYQFSEVFSMTQPRIQIQFYSFGGGRSTNRVQLKHLDSYSHYIIILH